MNKTTIQTFNFLLGAHGKKTARVLETISQEFRRSSEVLKVRTKQQMISN